MRQLSLIFVLLFTTSLGAGCVITIDQKVFYLPRQEASQSMESQRSRLVVGIRPFLMPSMEEESDPYLRDRAQMRLRQLAERFSGRLSAARVFADVIYPYEEKQKVDVVLEATLREEITKNRLTNFLTAFPGIIFPWIKGFGFDYDVRASVSLAVRSGQDLSRIHDVLEGEATMTAERVPSTLWLIGLHITVITMAIFESASTDVAVLEQLEDRCRERAFGAVLPKLAQEFRGDRQQCPDHPDVAGNTGEFCIICGKRLHYPILNRSWSAPAGK